MNTEACFPRASRTKGTRTHPQKKGTEKKNLCAPLCCLCGLRHKSEWLADVLLHKLAAYTRAVFIGGASDIEAGRQMSHAHNGCAASESHRNALNEAAVSSEEVNNNLLGILALHKQLLTAIMQTEAVG